MTLTDPQRAQLREFARLSVTLSERDSRWRITGELQLAGLVRLEWTGERVARVVLTEAGRDALAAAANDVTDQPKGHQQ